MANELTRFENPTNVPEAVSTGYQRQNTNLFCLQTGLDTTEPYDDGTSIIIPTGGLVEYNGFIFKITQDASILKPIATGQYFIGITDNNDGTASFIALDNPGSFDYTKNAYYNNGYRVLNWVSSGTPTIALPSLSDPSIVVNMTGYQTQYYNIIKKGWYRLVLKGAGGGGGSNTKGGDGGILDLFIFLDKKRIKLMSSAKGANSSGSYIGSGGGGTVVDLIDVIYTAGGGGGGANSSYNFYGGGGGGFGGGGGVGYSGGGGGGGYSGGAGSSDSGGGYAGGGGGGSTSTVNAAVGGLGFASRAKGGNGISGGAGTNGTNDYGIAGGGALGGAAGVSGSDGSIILQYFA